MIEIKKIKKEDEADWLMLRKQLWPCCSQERHCQEIKMYSSSMDKCALLAINKNDAAVGFCECSLRYDYRIN